MVPGTVRASTWLTTCRGWGGGAPGAATTVS
jgi:hypothetical protein